MKHSPGTGESQTDSYHQSDTECYQMFPNGSFSHTCDIRINQPWRANWFVCPLSTCCIFTVNKIPDSH